MTELIRYVFILKYINFEYKFLKINHNIISIKSPTKNTISIFDIIGINILTMLIDFLDFIIIINRL
mgnify:CR=1 FL=1